MNGPTIELNERGHVLATWGHVMIQVYGAEARRATVERATAIMRRLQREHPAGIGSVVVVQHGGRPPDDACRKAWGTQMRELRSQAILILFEGASMRAAIVRGVVTGLVLLAGRAVNLHVAATAREGLPWFVSEMEAAKAPCGSFEEALAAVEEARRLVLGG